MHVISFPHIHTQPPFHIPVRVSEPLSPVAPPRCGTPSSRLCMLGKLSVR